MKKRRPGTADRPVELADVGFSSGKRPLVPHQHTPHQASHSQAELRLLAAALDRAAEALGNAARQAERTALAADQIEAPGQPDDARLLTVAEAAKALRLSRSKLYVHVIAGDIPSITLGRSRRIPAAGLAAWIERRQFEQS